MEPLVLFGLGSCSIDTADFCRSCRIQAAPSYLSGLLEPNSKHLSCPLRPAPDDLLILSALIITQVCLCTFYFTGKASSTTLAAFTLGIPLYLFQAATVCFPNGNGRLLQGHWHAPVWYLAIIHFILFAILRVSLGVVQSWITELRRCSAKGKKVRFAQVLDTSEKEEDKNGEDVMLNLDLILEAPMESAEKTHSQEDIVTVVKASAETVKSTEASKESSAMSEALEDKESVRAKKKRKNPKRSRGAKKNKNNKVNAATAAAAGQEAGPKLSAEFMTTWD